MAAAYIRCQIAPPFPAGGGAGGLGAAGAGATRLRARASSTVRWTEETEKAIVFVLVLKGVCGVLVSHMTRFFLLYY